VILGFSAYNAWKNGNPSAFLWGLFAAVVVALLVPLAQAMIDWATDNGSTILGAS